MGRILSFCSVLAMLGGLARADDPAKPLDFSKPEDVFKQLDKNHDGQLTADEIPQEHRRLFERLLRKGDKNGDGKLSLEEFVAAVKDTTEAPAAGSPPAGPGGLPAAAGTAMPNLDEVFKRLDKNNDGKITADEVPEPRRENFKQALERLGKKPEDGLTKEEFGKVMGAILPRRADGTPPPTQPQANTPAGEALFRLLDKNGDGIISEDEISAATEVLQKFAKEHGGKITRESLGLPPRAATGSGPAAGPLAGQLTRGEFLLRRFKAMDKNGDGKVSKDEAEGMLKERFEEIDTNHDGFIDEAELKAAIEKIGDRARQLLEQRPGIPAKPGDATPPAKPDGK